MHIAEGFLPPAHAIGWTVAAAPFVVHGARAVVKEVREHPESTLLLGAAGAFTFVLSAIKLPSVTGSSSHPTGTGVGAILFRPPVMALLGTVVLLFQALLLAHGGLTTLGANAFAMAVVGPWAGYGAYRLARRASGRLLVGVFAGMAVADLATYVTTSLQLALAFPDAASGLRRRSGQVPRRLRRHPGAAGGRRGAAGRAAVPGADRQRPPRAGTAGCAAAAQPAEEAAR